MSQKQNYFSSAPPLFKLLIIFFFALSSFLVFLILGVLIAIPVFDIDYLRFNEYFNPASAENQAFMKYFQVLQAFGLFIVPALIAGVLLYKNSPDKFGLHLNTWPKFLAIIAGIIAMFASLPIINILVEINSNLSFPESMAGIEEWMKTSEEQAAEITKAFLNVSTVEGMLFNLFMIALLPAIGEEFLFRGLIQRSLIDFTKNKHAGVLLAAILFSALHFQFYGFLPRMVLGLILGYLFIWSKSIWLPIIAHFVNNASAVIVHFMYSDEIVESKLDKIGTNRESMYMFFAGLILCSAMMYLVYRVSEKKPAPSQGTRF